MAGLPLHSPRFGRASPADRRAGYRDGDPQHRAGGDGRSAAIALRISWNRARGTATSAIWKITERPWRTILAPIFTSRSRSVVIDHSLDLLGQRQGAEEVGEVVGQRVQLQPHGIRLEALAGQPRPGDGVLAFLDPLLRRATLVVEHHHPLGRSRHVGDDEADAGIQFARMPLDLRHTRRGLFHDPAW